MPHVQFQGWSPPLEKIALNHVLRRRAGLSLSDAKRVVDQVLDGQSVDVTVDSLETGRELVREATEIGAHCELVRSSASDEAPVGPSGRRVTDQ